MNESGSVAATKPDEGNQQFITFRLADAVLISPLALIEEVTDPLPTTEIGGTHDWFRGLASKKGRLVPVSDLGDYAINKPSRHEESAKWLIITRDSETVGLIVDEVIGLTESPRFQSSNSGIGNFQHSPLEPLITGRATLRGSQKHDSEEQERTASVVDLGRLLTQQRFIQVGVSSS